MAHPNSVEERPEAEVRDTLHDAEALMMRGRSRGLEPYPLYSDTYPDIDGMYAKLVTYKAKWDTRKWTPRIRYIYPNFYMRENYYLRLVNYYEDYVNMNAITDYFSEYLRIRCNVLGKDTPLDQWNSDRIQSIARQHIDLDTMQMRDYIYEHNLIVECTLYKCTAAKAIADIFNARRVLDLSCGWGDRLIGSLAADVECYHGCDPNVDLQPVYDEITRRFATGDQDVVIKAETMEAYEIRPNYYDLMHSSPPHWNKEIYAHSNIFDYSNLNHWIEGFLYLYLRKSCDALVRRGRLAIYLNDYYDTQMCDKMNRYLENVLHMSYLGVIGLTTRVASKESTRSLWIWAKP